MAEVKVRANPSVSCHVLQIALNVNRSRVKAAPQIANTKQYTAGIVFIPVLNGT